MLVFDFHEIGNKLFTIRKKNGKTQAEVAEAAGLSDRTYADIERGTVNMRVETKLRICRTLHITPDEILTKEKEEVIYNQGELCQKLNELSKSEKETVLRIFRYIWIRCKYKKF